MMNETNRELNDLIASFKDFIKEKEIELGIRQLDSRNEDTLTEKELMNVFDISRTTLYRARKKGNLPFLYTANGGVEYNYAAIILALKTNRFKIPNTSSLKAIEKIREYQNLKSISYGEGY